MRFALVGVLVLGSALPAFAMGTNESIDLVAWSDDGAAALLHVHTDRDGDTSESYVVISNGDHDPVSTEIAGIAWLDDNHPHEQTVDRSTCASHIRALGTAIAAHHITGVTLRPERCTSDKRDDAVTTGTAAKAEVRASLVRNPGVTARDKQIWRAFETATGVGIVATPDPTADFPSATIATKTGKLVIALFIPSQGSPTRTTILAFVPDAGRFAPFALGS